MGKKKNNTKAKSQAITSSTSTQNLDDGGESASISQEQQIVNALQSTRKKPNSQNLLDLHYMEPLMKQRVKKGMVVQQLRKDKKESIKKRSLSIKHQKRTDGYNKKDMKVITSNKLFGKLKVKCLEIPHYA